MKRTARNASPNYYELLQVSPRARPEVIHAAYRALMKAHDADEDAGFVGRLSEAYGILATAESRARYDREREDLGGKIIGQFRVLEPIAEGGFGKTYKGEHVLVREPVCIKHCSRISADDAEILIEEARAMWDLRHYAFPAVRNLLQLDDGSLALVMSYIKGKTLAQIVEKHGALDPEHVAWITQRILNALKYLHYHGVVHGDIKPQNVIVQPESHIVVLVDFGLSAIKPTRDTGSKGYTDLFAPPEQVKGSTLIPETDFYSLGMTMIHALSGGMEHVERKEVPEKVPDPLCDFIRRLTVREVLERPNWEKEDLFETIEKVRVESFGRATSNMKPLPGV